MYVETTGASTVAVLVHMRKRPWLGGCLGMLVIGVSALIRSHLGYLVFWAGIAAIVGGLLIALGGELGVPAAAGRSA